MTVDQNSKAPGLDEIIARIDELGPRFRERMRGLDEAVQFPEENFAEAKAAGLHALCLPTEYGGAGLWLPGNYGAWYEILERLAWWESNTAQLLQVHNHAAGIIAWHSTPEQRDHFLPRILDGAFCASLGSEAHIFENGAEKLAAELTKVEGGYRLTARKGFASVAAVARYLMVWAAVEGDTAYAHRLVFAVVDTESEGVELLDDWQMLGMRSTISCGVKFTDVFIPDDHVVGEPGGWVTSDPRTFSCAYAANHLGSAQAAFDFIAEYIGQREDLAGSEAVRVKLGKMDADLFAARTALRSTGARLDRGDDPDECEADAVRTMHLAKEVVLAIPYEGFDLVGARACHERYPLGQMMRDARTFTLHFRDDLYLERLAKMALGQGFSAKGGRGGSTPFEVDPIDAGQAHAGA
ncbi:MAG: acyl-CoA/acyl-ACP dehydrogenase [Acidimicrobiia bacterium]|nr:acyl-CoA/acyl-ACP dehydrogenase [Actinomycetota bacterium]MBL6925964.1 acyl-CoA/acyl-ACP dehydrogenase [Acidimicrobiia bacterium]